MTVSTGWVAPNSATLDLSNGAIVTETNMDAIASDLFNLGGLTGHIGARAYNSANLSIPHNTSTNLTFNSERYDTDPNGEIHSTASNTGRLTCRTAGKYLLAATVAFDANATGVRSISLLLNGASFIAQVQLPSAGSTFATSLSIATLYDLAAGDYVEVAAFQTSGGALNVLVGSTPFSPEFAFAKA